jgi:hypothetical protein
LVYYLSIALIWKINRQDERPDFVVKLLEQDREIQAARLARRTLKVAQSEQTNETGQPSTVPNLHLNSNPKRIMDIRRHYSSPRVSPQV